MDNESENKNFRKSLWQTRHNQEFTDFTFTCGASRFPVHKVIICSQSKVFHAACTRQFEVSLPFILMDIANMTQESSTNTFNLSEFSDDYVQWLIDFLYTGTYPMETSKVPTLADHIYMFAMGDMYRIEPLAQYAADKVRIGLSQGLNLEEVLPLIPQVYNSTPEHRQELRKMVVKFMISPAHGKNQAIEEREWYDDMAQQCPEFIKELLFTCMERSSSRAMFFSLI
ncbi:unnamed protein product [Fusarium fujikuroi]|uniref:BTB domain-containing protein n=1 Tax=Fusarium fujikuroi TaxID=5127 RepID=A0A9Q9RUT2_FUSFU|nr:unnamed protein product [Fusarium fujikuroi]VTT77049.1 unnamed protein product [Fusarium fujikuroi]VZH89779.1 unnamed protein product [Fusarium fujikuroi]